MKLNTIILSAIAAGVLLIAFTMCAVTTTALGVWVYRENKKANEPPHGWQAEKLMFPNGR